MATDEELQKLPLLASKAIASTSSFDNSLYNGSPQSTMGCELLPHMISDSTPSTKMQIQSEGQQNVKDLDEDEERIQKEAFQRQRHQLLLTLNAQKNHVKKFLKAHDSLNESIKDELGATHHSQQYTTMHLVASMRSASRRKYKSMLDSNSEIMNDAKDVESNIESSPNVLYDTISQDIMQKKSAYKILPNTSHINSLANDGRTSKESNSFHSGFSNGKEGRYEVDSADGEDEEAHLTKYYQTASIQNASSSSITVGFNSVQPKMKTQESSSQDPVDEESFESFWNDYKNTIVNKKKQNLYKMSKALVQLNDYRKLIIDSALNKDRLQSLEKKNNELDQLLSKLESQLQVISFDEEQYKRRLMLWKRHSNDKDQMLISTLKREENKIHHLRDVILTNTLREDRKWEYLNQMMKTCVSHNSNAEIIYQCFLCVEKVHNYFTNRMKEWKQYRFSKPDAALPMTELIMFLNHAPEIAQEEIFLQKHWMSELVAVMKRDIMDEMSKYLKLPNERSTLDDYTQLLNEQDSSMEFGMREDTHTKIYSQISIGIQTKLKVDNSAEVLKMIEESLAKKDRENRREVMLRLLSNSKRVQMSVETGTAQLQTEEYHVSENAPFSQIYSRDDSHEKISQRKLTVSETLKSQENKQTNLYLENDLQANSNIDSNLQMKTLYIHDKSKSNISDIAIQTDSSMLSKSSSFPQTSSQVALHIRHPEASESDNNLISQPIHQDDLNCRKKEPSSSDSVSKEILRNIEAEKVEVNEVKVTTESFPMEVDISTQIEPTSTQKQKALHSEYQGTISKLQDEIGSLKLELKRLQKNWMQPALKDPNVQANTLPQDSFLAESLETQSHKSTINISKSNEPNTSSETIILSKPSETVDLYLSQLIFEKATEDNEHIIASNSIEQSVENTFNASQYSYAQERQSMGDTIVFGKEIYSKDLFPTTGNEFPDNEKSHPLTSKDIIQKTKTVQTAYLSLDVQEKSIQTKMKGIPNDKHSKTFSKNETDVGPVGLVMIEIEKLSKIFLVDHEIASITLEMYNNIVHNLLANYEGIIIKQYYASGGYVCAFTKVTNAVKFSQNLLKKLNNTAWPYNLMYIRCCRAIKDDKNGTTLYRGPRVSTSIITSSHSILGKDLITRGDQSILDSLRQLIHLNNMARGGLVVVSNEVYKDIKINLLIANGLYISKPVKSNLREIQTQCPIRVILPMKLQGRHDYIMKKNIKDKIAKVSKSSDKKKTHTKSQQHSTRSTMEAKANKNAIRKNAKRSEPTLEGDQRDNSACVHHLQSELPENLASIGWNASNLLHRLTVFNNRGDFTSYTTKPTISTNPSSQIDPINTSIHSESLSPLFQDCRSFLQELLNALHTNTSNAQFYPKTQFSSQLNLQSNQNYQSYGQSKSHPLGSGVGSGVSISMMHTGNTGQNPYTSRMIRQSQTLQDKRMKHVYTQDKETDHPYPSNITSTAFHQSTQNALSHNQTSQNQTQNREFHGESKRQRNHLRRPSSARVDPRHIRRLLV